MESLFKLIGIFLHVDLYLREILKEYGFWIYLILFIVIFCETGLVFTPFFPGDSLLFTCGTFAALSFLNLELLLFLLSFAAILGDTVNYFIGFFFGQRLFSSRPSYLLNRKYLEKTERFYERHGGKTIVIARFIPIVRTFAPFVAGIGRMRYYRFLFFNIFGGIFWVFLCILSGFFFGNIPFVKEHFTIILLAIILVSLFPALIGFLSEQRRALKRY